MNKLAFGLVCAWELLQRIFPLLQGTHGGVGARVRLACVLSQLSNMLLHFLRGPSHFGPKPCDGFVQCGRLLNCMLGGAY